MKQTYQINVAAVIGCAIATAYNQREWCPDTSIEEVYDDFDGIREYAEANLKWMGIEDVSVSNYEIANALWGYDEDNWADFIIENHLEQYEELV